jgi:outer membrane receptor protein involved in Fe transport
MKKNLLLFIYSLCFLLLSTGYVFAQGTVTGTVKDNSGTLPGVSVQIKGTTQGTITDVDGNFSLNVPDANTVLVFSFIGYASQEVPVQGQKTLEVTLVQDAMNLSEIVITGVVNNKSALESSVSITSIKPKSIDRLGAVTTAEIFKSIPGVHSESTGGEGNANISVRGIPISTGGSKFLQLQEDGLPVMQFGDIQFGNADIFVRADQTIARIEAIRGGSASTFASNSPAGIINFISNTGSIEGGTIGTSVGVDYNEYRTDFNYGAPIGNGFRFDIGGFYRHGEGPRICGYDGNKGGQIKANITKEFKNGYVRLYYKHLDDKAISYMPMPVAVTGDGKNATFTSIPGFDLHHATLQSSQFFNMLGYDDAGNPRTTNISDGMHPVVNALGTEFSFDIGDGWKILDKSRLALTSGSFKTLFPTGQFQDITTYATSVLGTGATASYANGVNAGKPLSGNINGNGLLMNLASFDVDLNSMNNFTNDLNISKKFNKVNITAGYYKAYQQIAQYWEWQGYNTDVSNQPKLVNIKNATGDTSTFGGVRTYGQWGLARKYDMNYNINAPYANIGIDLDQINIDASIRYDYGTVNGYWLGTTQVANKNITGKTTGGVTDYAEISVPVVDNTKINTVNYNYNYISYSIGANYKIDNQKAIYARISSGGRANADRLLYSPYIFADGTATHTVDMVQQYEAGFKYSSPVIGLMVTPFYSVVNEQNQDVTEQTFYLIGYHSYGIELEASAQVGGLTVTAGGIYTHARISSSNIASQVGMTPRRVPDLMYNINPSYKLGKASIGFSLIGTTKVWSQNDNLIALPAYAYVNGFVSYEITKGLSFSVNVNNLFDTLGFTEMENDDAGYNAGQTNYMRARPITGRATKASLTYRF